MKITRLAIFGFTFFIGVFSISFLKSSPQMENKAKIETQEPRVVQIVAKIDTPQLQIFNIEDFWDEGVNQQNKRLLEIGEISNTEDIKAKSGETWLGLFNENGKDVLRSTKIKVSYERDLGLDWKNVSVKGKSKPLFLLKKSRNLKEGEIKTLLREKTQNETDEGNEAATIREDFFKNFTLGEREFTLRTVKGLSENQEPILVLLLETEKISQIIHIVYFEEGNYIGNLYWVGDLDGDGKLDLFMDFYGYEKGGYRSGLFLSSEAEKGRLVKKLEYFALSAC